ncbi:MAG TPA: GNAT family N-acetyltransferase [Thermomicrobiales bacterium]
MAQVDIREGGAIPEKQLRELFAALGWDDLIGLLPDLLLNSTFVVSAWDGARLVGLSRVVSDRVYISTLQQVGVHPDYQRQGLGSDLVRRCIARFATTRFILTTDDASNETFYARFGFEAIGNAMVRPGD